MSEYNTIKQICDEYSVSRKTVERWMKTGLLYTKLNDNNGSVRIKKTDVERMIQGKTSDNPIIRLRWGEYQAKLAISSDLNKEVKNTQTRIQNYDEFKSYYPQDFYIKLSDIKILINVVSLDNNDLKIFEREDQEERFKKNFTANDSSLRLIVLFVGFNDNLPEEYFEFRPDEVVNMLTINLKDITDLNIMDYINQY